MVVTSFAYCEIILERFYLKIEPCFIPFHVPALTYSNIWFGLFTISWNSLFQTEKKLLNLVAIHGVSADKNAFAGDIVLEAVPSTAAQVEFVKTLDGKGLSHI